MQPTAERRELIAPHSSLDQLVSSPFYLFLADQLKKFKLPQLINPNQTVEIYNGLSSYLGKRSASVFEQLEFGSLIYFYDYAEWNKIYKNISAHPVSEQYQTNLSKSQNEIFKSKKGICHDKDVVGQAAFQTAIDAQEKQGFYRIDSPILKFSRDVLGQRPNVDRVDRVANIFIYALWEIRTYGYHKPTFYLSLFPIPKVMKTDKDPELITPEWLYQKIEHFIPQSV